MAIVAVVMLAGCGRFQRADSGAATTTGPRTVQTLPPLTTIAGTPTTAPHTTATAARPTASTARRDPCAPPNQSVTDDPSGFRLILTVAPKQCVRQGEDLTLQLEIQNISKQPLQYDSNQTHFFDILPEAGNGNSSAWSDQHCRGTTGFPVNGGPLTLNPGEKAVRSSHVYPASKDRADREKCRTLGGHNLAYASLTWCPPGSVVNGMCDPAKSKSIVSSELPVTIS
jgi:hypothetical protein